MTGLKNWQTYWIKMISKLLALKMVGSQKGLYPYPGSCPMGDVDVLVSKTIFRRAHMILTDAGYELKFRSPLEEDNIEAAEHGGGAEYSVKLDNGEHLWFELQWRPVAGRWIQPDQEPQVDDLIKRSKPIINSKLDYYHRKTTCFKLHFIPQNIHMLDLQDLDFIQMWIGL